MKSRDDPSSDANRRAWAGKGPCAYPPTLSDSSRFWWGFPALSHFGSLPSKYLLSGRSHINNNGYHTGRRETAIPAAFDTCRPRKTLILCHCAARSRHISILYHDSTITMALKDADRVLSALEALQTREISIIKLSEPITTAISQLDPTNTAIRTSDVSNSSLEAPTPASLEADLAHYRELFSKLRFSYVEQVTKEKFIRAIVGDPPLIVTPAENLALERENVTAKAQLKALKADVAATIDELETLGRDLARRYERIVVETARLRELPERMASLEESIAGLREVANGGDGEDGGKRNKELNLPLERTLELVAERKRKAAELGRQLGTVSAQVPRKRKEAERLAAELASLETRRQNNVAAALEARKRKEARLGGAEDDLEERGRWLRASETLLRTMLEI